ncbi:MAG: tRNA guanosine(15) transglycosylase TgtA, partial [Candidatus Bathyarchaeota archaeon]|nr:tRNA guanosine(15) transglycosylase TgtA [Candidatus Bathyarchaeota archaeon]
MMCFEVKNKDLLGRIGKIKTKSGVIETPLLLPVINPKKIEIHPKEVFEEFKFKALMTNAYILKKYFEKDIIKVGIHEFLGFNGVVMTDSGGYQVLRYGHVDVKPLEIFDFQEKIGSDIGVILDVPTGWSVSRNYAEWTVNETIKRAKEVQNHLENEHTILWVGPVQGGSYLDLISLSASELSKIPFDVYAIGSPTQVMERYLFDFLVKMILAAKLNLPLNKPLHLFGAGHPLIFSFIVALGCDMFDSASYALYARDERYLTETGTVRLKNLEYFLCDCPVCRSLTPKDLKEKEESEKRHLLMRHNLYVCWREIQRIKQYISEGKLWELLELRARAHPSLFKAFNLIAKLSKLFLNDTPLFKERGMFIFDEISAKRPEVISYKE